MAGLIGVAVLLVGGLAIALFAGGGGGHTVRAAFDSAVQIVPGQEVRVAGRKVGEVGSVEEVDGQAVLELDVEDDEVWPLRRGTTARLRWGSNTGYALRYVELHPGPPSAPPLPDRGLLTRADTVTPVELDEIYRIFRGRTREDLGELVGELGETFGGRGRPLEQALRNAPEGLDQTTEVLRELGADPAALRMLAVAGDRTASALAVRDRDLRDLIDQAAGTFDELAEHATAQRESLDRLPDTLRTGGDTLARLDVSLVGLDALVHDLGPGARALRTLAPRARGALAELREVAPIAAATLRRGTRAAPPLARLLRTGTPFLPRLASVLDQSEPALDCVRPYGPEIAGLLSTWIGFGRNYDAQGHYARAFLQASPVPPGTADNSEQAVAARTGRLFYAMPRPPGLNAGQTWFQPQCGAGPEALDPSKDPEGAGAER